MLTVLNAINLSSDYLEKKGIESPRTNAELMLAHILKCKRLDLYLSYDRPLTEEETNLYRELIKRRGEHEPLQYITGKVEFYSLEFEVTPSVLIPRPETEILVETIINLYRDKNELRILDIGTGSGNIAISLARFINDSIITAVDISDEALKQAEKNAKAHSVDNQITFLHYNIFSDANLQKNEFDVIVSNPPYISVEEFSELQPELKFYEPRIALTDETNGLKFYMEIISKSLTLLKKGGSLFFELAIGKASDVERLMKESDFINIQIVKDYQNIERVIYGAYN